MTYNVVIFKKDNTVEAVPSHWLSRDEKTCAWPNKNLNPSRLIEKKSFPNTLEYKWYEVRNLLKDIVSLKEAKAKASRATFTSDLSADENKETRKNRKKIDDDNYVQLKKISKKNSTQRILHKIVSPPRFIETDVSDKDDSDFDSTYIPYSNEKKNFSPVITCFERKMRDELQNSILKNDKLPITASTSQQSSLSDKGLKYGVSTSKNIVFNSPSLEKIMIDNNLNSTKTTKRKLDFDSTTICSVSHKLNYSNSVSQSPNHSDSFQMEPDLSSSKSPKSFKKDLEGINNTLMNLTRSIVNMKYDIKNMTTKMDRVEKIMSDLQKNSSKSFSKGNNPIDAHIFNFPITSYEELKVFEEKLLDIEFRQKVVQFLARQEREMISDMTRQIMSKLFHNNLLSQFSYAGQKKKKVFSTLNSCAIIFETIRTVPNHMNCTDQEVLKPMKFYMANAKFREEKKQHKITNPTL